VLEIMPEMIGRMMVKIDTTAVLPTEPGEMPLYEEPDTEILTLDATALTYALVNAVKTLAAVVADLRQQVRGH
jgi:hypothetical protein